MWKDLNKGSHSQRGDQSTGYRQNAQNRAVIVFLRGLFRLSGRGCAGGSGGIFHGPVCVHSGITGKHRRGADFQRCSLPA